jgi:hypothetical protein
LRKYVSTDILPPNSSQLKKVLEAEVEAMAFIGLRILYPRWLVVTLTLFAKP